MISPKPLALSFAIAGWGALAWATEPETPEPPRRYDLSIDGENFTVDSGQITKLDSRQHPGTSYQVAVRPAQRQHWSLNHVQFDYELGFQLVDDHKPAPRTATLKHPLGFVAVLTDLGGPLPAEAKTSAFDQLVEGMKKILGPAVADDLTISKPQRRKLGDNQAVAVTFSYRDANGDERMSAVYLITGEKFACTCILQCSEKNREDAVDLVKSTLASLAPQ